MPALLVGKLAYHDTFSGLILCKVLSISGHSRLATSSIDVEFELLENRGAYKKGEILRCSSLWVYPVKAIRRLAYKTVIGQYEVGTPANGKPGPLL